MTFHQKENGSDLVLFVYEQGVENSYNSLRDLPSEQTIEHTITQMVDNNKLTPEQAEIAKRDLEAQGIPPTTTGRKAREIFEREKQIIRELRRLGLDEGATLSAHIDAYNNQ